ncbi:MAG: ATP-binding cassette domain-containing protein [Acidimicrobiales bacterium]
MEVITTASSVGDGDGQAPVAIASPVLEARRISKAFGHVQALSEVDLDLLPGEVLGLVGDNGAGKSTLIKILSGVLQPDSGEIVVNGQRAHLHSPVAARSLGIETVYQELAVVPMLDVAENLFLGREVRLGGRFGHLLPIINRRAMQRQAREQFNSLNIGMGSLHQRVETLSGGQRQGVAVSRAVLFGRSIVILDEPTAALGVRESKAVLGLIQTINQRGMSIILISHNMPQVFELTTRILVLRAGRRAGVVRTAETDMEQVVRLMTGAEIQQAS